MYFFITSHYTQTFIINLPSSWYDWNTVEKDVKSQVIHPPIPFCPWLLSARGLIALGQTLVKNRYRMALEKARSSRHNRKGSWADILWGLIQNKKENCCILFYRSYTSLFSQTQLRLDQNQTAPKERTIFHMDCLIRVYTVCHKFNCWNHTCKWFIIINLTESRWNVIMTEICSSILVNKTTLTLLHLERPKLHRVLAILNETGLKKFHILQM